MNLLRYWGKLQENLAKIVRSVGYFLIHRWTRRAAVLLLVSGGIMYELHTSTLQAKVLTQYASRLSYEVAAGPSSQIGFPPNGPFDRQRGYAQLPSFQLRLLAEGYHVTQQARHSPELTQLTTWGITPPYREPTLTGLTIRDARGMPIYDARPGNMYFQRFEDIPPLLVQTLLFIENQELQNVLNPRHNPAVEWDRFARAGLLYIGKQLGLPVSIQGGSTLATQLEKYRHSPQGRTETPTDKARQIVGASLKAYRPGIDPLSWRRTIILDYLNTMPLSAAPGHGEIYGIGAGLSVWFGVPLSLACEALTSTESTAAKVHAFKHSLALIVALRAPTTYLVRDHTALNTKVNTYARLLADAGVIDVAFAQSVHKAPLLFVPFRTEDAQVSFVGRKDINAMRSTLLTVLGVSNPYDLDRLHLDADSTIDTIWQREVTQVLQNLGDPTFVAAHGLDREVHLLRGVDPSKVIYSALLLERTPQGNVVRVHTDTLNQPLDMNRGIKLELGSTAKLRTLAHYLEIVALLHRELGPLSPEALALEGRNARDSLTRWAAETLRAEPHVELATLLQRALDRRYSASPGEAFFTGGGVHTFSNFSRLDNRRIMSVREALQRSTNLVFIRLMRDLVRFHQARLPYDATAILTQPDHPQRRLLLQQAAEEEAKTYLWRSYEAYHNQSPETIITRLLGHNATSPRHLAILFFAWHDNADQQAFDAWLASRLSAPLTEEGRQRLWRAYSNPQLTLADYGYLLSRHPLDVWCAGELVREPTLVWQDLLRRSSTPRQVVSTWLFKTRNRRAQDQRLRIHIERDAFAQMAPHWRRLGFPFAQLVPSYALAIGSGADRPDALADLMGIIVNDGMRRPTYMMNKLHFAQDTPYETVFAPDASKQDHVMDIAVARALRHALTTVVTAGTAQRVNGIFVGPNQLPVTVGGKTGSGDNQLITVSRKGRTRSVQSTNRTATFVFYIGDRYYGVLMAYVPGREADKYHFTSSLPVSVLKLISPSVNARLQEEPQNLMPTRLEKAQKQTYRPKT
jgi:membrane peptidoglycan carboxypeptidase